MFLFVTYTIIQSITSSEMCSLHLTHPSAHTPGAVHSHTHTHTHTWSSGQPTLRRPGSSWGFGALLKGLTSVVDFLPELRFEPTTSGYKSDALSIRPRLSFIAKADNSNRAFLAKAANSTFHVLEFRKHWFNLCNVFRWSRCLTDVVVVIINCMDVITRDTQSFSFTIVTCCFLKDPWKHLCLYFPFLPWRRYQRFIKIIHPRSLLVRFDETPLS